jgi:hypothetical protein
VILVCLREHVPLYKKMGVKRPIAVEDHPEVVQQYNIPGVPFLLLDDGRFFIGDRAVERNIAGGSRHKDPV